MSVSNDIDLLKRLCSIPTAPFAEHRVIDFVERWARRRRRLIVRADRFGNRLIECPGHRRLPRLVMVAHGDHPGLLAGATDADGTLHADFHGGVMPEYLPGAEVQFYATSKPVAATILKAEPDERGRASRITLRVSGAVPAGTVGMFALGEARLRGKRMHCRACDDLAGVSAALSVLDRLARKPATAPAALLLTRAEEQGFIGAIASVEHPALLRKTDLLVSLECSAEQPFAKQGLGTIIRVGDRTSIFDSSLTAFMVEQATALTSADAAFRFQRALMPGGTCEATVFDAWGYTAAAVCVALGNYHNMDRTTRRLAAEHIHLDDWTGMVTLLEQVARYAHHFSSGMKSLRRTLVERFERYRSLL